MFVHLYFIDSEWLIIVSEVWVLICSPMIFKFWFYCCQYSNVWKCYQSFRFNELLTSILSSFLESLLELISMEYFHIVEFLVKYILQKFIHQLLFHWMKYNLIYYVLIEYIHQMKYSSNEIIINEGMYLVL